MRDVLITGIGLVSGLGEGVEVHRAALGEGRSAPLDTTSFAPYPVHPLGSVNFDLQIPKKSDQRQMEPWQRIGVYAAGLALDSAGLKGDAGLKDRLQLIVAAGGGERDHAVDGQVLTGLKTAPDAGVYLNERLTSDLRPTLFLAQLSNLLAGNIAIVHGVTGASRTFMGEEQAGVDAIRIAQARIAAGQADIILVGGAYNAERRDMLLLFELGGAAFRGDIAIPTFARADNDAPAQGMITGSVGAFLVLESAGSAAQRGATAMARLGAVAASSTPRKDAAAVAGSLSACVRQILAGDIDMLVSAATGCALPTAGEAVALDALAPNVRRVATGDLVGHAVEAAFPASVALAAGLAAAGDARHVLVTGVGHHRGEGAALVSAL